MARAATSPRGDRRRTPRRTAETTDETGPEDAGFPMPPPRQRAGEGLGDFAYRVLREAIRSGHFRSGRHLREADVARWLDISRTPVREAFHRIVSEGLLVSGPWNGLMIASLDRQQLVELYAVREVLEGTAAALAAQHASPAEIDLMFSIAASETAAKDDPDRLVVINAELHQTIYGAAHNRYLLQSLNAVVDSLGLLRHSTFVLPGSTELARREHVEILRAIKERNARKAEQLARRHIRHALALRLRLQHEEGG
ncbi:GntR family transcriptional regulator [Rhodoplanes sp. TEM]|uniref:GntR family transcriptional regulator n=1 Tax=Rhodoplanes tepidamans TaxID=200616 RepID=A0ABT5JDT9_RHOTP|nr:MULTISPECIES: GntR family transcriptional regulator [Rhodoplanes]MDC7787845.1 GntR family transcriptional regulator [Rhodoplanes tepidamans]MDC7985696.1 GntR family transcriptional regulator [Rhodoplanes sp. TEM]MDQ0357892.1 DNA-binding GntR family transcriptional regulator [Rhodoplanes tepidamans]